MVVDPVLIAYAVQRRGQSGRTFWRRIGEAYPNNSGAGLTVILDVLPADGRIVLLERDEGDDRRLAARAARHAKEYRQRRQ